MFQRWLLTFLNNTMKDTRQVKLLNGLYLSVAWLVKDIWRKFMNHWHELYEPSGKNMEGVIRWQTEWACLERTTGDLGHPQDGWSREWAGAGLDQSVPHPGGGGGVIWACTIWKIPWKTGTFLGLTFRGLVWPQAAGHQDGQQPSSWRPLPRSLQTPHLIASGVSWEGCCRLP